MGWRMRAVTKPPGRVILRLEGGKRFHAAAENPDLRER